MSTTKGTRPIDANNLARRIREYMDGFPNATTRLVTCRAILSMLGDEKQTPTLRAITRKQVEKVWRGEWDYPTCEWNLPKCSKCGCNSKDATYGHKSNFCPRCGEAMTDKAVDMVMERLEALRDE